MDFKFPKIKIVAKRTRNTPTERKRIVMILVFNARISLVGGGLM